MRKSAAKVLLETAGAVMAKAPRRKRVPVAAAPAIETPAIETIEAPVSEVRITPAVTHEMIAARAYALYVARGGANGHAHEDWARAERELTQR